MKTGETIILNNYWVIHKEKLGNSKKATFNLGFGDLETSMCTPQLYNSKFQLKKSMRYYSD